MERNVQKNVVQHHPHKEHELPLVKICHQNVCLAGCTTARVHPQPKIPPNRYNRGDGTVTTTITITNARFYSLYFRVDLTTELWSSKYEKSAKIKKQLLVTMWCIWCVLGMLTVRCVGWWVYVKNTQALWLQKKSGVYFSMMFTKEFWNKSSHLM